MEKIEKQQQYGQFFNEIDLKTAVFEINGQGLKRAYKSRSGAAAKNRTSRIFVGSSKRKYYMLCDLTKDQLERLKKFNKDLAYYTAAKDKGLKGLKRPIEPRFNNVKPHYIAKKGKYKDRTNWDSLAKRYEDIVISTFNCSGNFKKGEFFITLTQRDGRIKSQELADAHYNAFLKAFKRWISGKKNKAGKPFKDLYSMLTIKEYGSHGYHYHILLKIDLTYTDLKDWIKQHWKKKHGFYQIESLKDALKLSRYFFGSSNDRVAMQNNIKGLDKQLQQLEQQQSDLIELKKKAHKKGLKDQEKSYEDGIKATKETLKQLRRSKVKSDDTIIRASGEIKRGLKLVTNDKRLLKFVSEKAQYLYSERVIVSDTSDLDGQTYILNEVFSDYYRIDKQDRAWLYAYCEKLIATGRAIKK
ncbi:rolling circle replication-associated protein [Ligilactobacillus salivarius]|uniref:rolling circle replication-associated protein n=1 Tax=Ligilactobacillus salivarius TaxID=1624 RepID=UPI000BAF4C31|nr:hypothetical protein [Ligilactobacillus salivarius]MBE7388263.1 hypothetical protein [Ligilactobacillus salivarius]MBE7392817.1 hypothetical protein [Ligilactobacillus salivarius]PAY39429.1 hypothetical protein A8C39_10240 [Ligilactobacillus salivarius]PAY59478.1 hypothetical protein A8C41_10545 [Ligilactobacillus salivarius]